jgi:hypothetical protein
MTYVFSFDGFVLCFHLMTCCGASCYHQHISEGSTTHNVPGTSGAPGAPGAPGNVIPDATAYPVLPGAGGQAGNPHQWTGGWNGWPANNQNYVQNSEYVNYNPLMNQGANHVTAWHGFPGGVFPPAPPHDQTHAPYLHPGQHVPHGLQHLPHEPWHPQVPPVPVNGQMQAHYPQHVPMLQNPNVVAPAGAPQDAPRRRGRPSLDSDLRDSNLTEALVKIKNTLDPQKFAMFISKGSALLEPDAYYEVFNQLPRELRLASLRAPPGVVVDVKKTLEHADQGAMFGKLCQLRRERCAPLAAPSQTSHWTDESWDTVPMAKHCKTHFWDLFNNIPISTTDPVRWKNVMNFMKDCPEKSEPRQNVDRFVEWGSVDKGCRGRSESRHPETPRRRSKCPRRSRSPRRSGDSSRKNDDLRTLQSWGQSSPQADDVNSRTSFIKRKVEEDIETLSLDHLVLNSKHKFPSKLSPSECLRKLPEIRHKPEVFQAVYQIYLRKFSRLLDPLPSQASKLWKAFVILLEGLNVKIVRGGAGNPGIKDVAELIAFLKTVDMCEKPH